MMENGYKVEKINENKYEVYTEDRKDCVTLYPSNTADNLTKIAKHQGVSCDEIPVFNIKNHKRYRQTLVKSAGDKEGLFKLLLEELDTNTYNDYIRIYGLLNRTYSIKEFKKENLIEYISNKDEMYKRLQEDSICAEEAYEYIENLDKYMKSSYSNPTIVEDLKGTSYLRSKAFLTVMMLTELRLAWYTVNVGEIDEIFDNIKIKEAKFGDKYDLVETYIKSKYGYCPKSLYKLELDREFIIVNKLKESYNCNEVLVSYGLNKSVVKRLAKDNCIFNFDTLENMGDFLFIVNCFNRSDVYPYQIWDYYDALCSKLGVIKSIEYDNLMDLPKKASIIHLCINVQKKTIDYLNKEYGSSLVWKHFRYIASGSCYIDEDIEIEKVFYIN